MANKPFEYTIINPLERPTSTDINQLQAQAHYDVRQFAYEIFGRQNGFLGYSFNPEPNSPADGTFYIQQGVAFQYGAAENNIGGIAGLSDSYQQKAVTTVNRQITAEAVPAGVGEKRYDLLMIRAPAGDERLVNATNVGIFTPSLVSFDAVSKYKTLTSSLVEYEVESIASTGTPTSPIVYKSGEVFTGAWDPVNKPSVDTGYLGVAYIRRYQGQTAIEAADIEDARTLLTLPTMVGGTSGTLPVVNGGTGNSSTSADTGSVVWYDSVEDKFKYTQANLGAPSYLPVSGYVLLSNASGAPTWVPQSLHYSANYTGSYNNNTVAWTQISDLTLTDIALRAGVVRIQLQPYNSLDEEDYSIGTDTGASGGEAMIKFEISGATSRVFIFPYAVGPNNDSSLAFPSFDVVVNAGEHTITVWGKVKQTTTYLFVQKCAIVASQG